MNNINKVQTTHEVKKLTKEDKVILFDIIEDLNDSKDIAELRSKYTQYTRELIKTKASPSATSYLENALKKVENTLSERITDNLTGLYNRRFFDHRLSEELSKYGRNKGNITLITSDLNHFKKLNDTEGHAAGDRTLIEYAKILDENSRDCDLVARYGGDEFQTALLGTCKEKGAEAAERMRKATEKANFAKGKGKYITASFGVADLLDVVQAVPFDDGEDSTIIPERLKLLIECGDQALYKAKENRNSVAIYQK